MLEKTPLNDVIDIIHQPEIFYKEAHQKIYAAIQELFSSSESIARRKDFQHAATFIG